MNSSNNKALTIVGLVGGAVIVGVGLLWGLHKYEENTKKSSQNISETQENDVQANESELKPQETKNEVSQSAPAPEQIAPEEKKQTMNDIDVGLKTDWVNNIENKIKGKTIDYSQFLSEVKQKVDAEINSETLSMRAIMAINDLLVEFVAKDFEKITFVSRESRRKVRSIQTLQQYEQMVIIGTQQIEQLLQVNMQKVCIDVGTTMEKYENSNMHWAKINPQFALLSMMMLDKMKLMMTSNTPNVTIENAVSVFDYQLQIFPTLADLKFNIPQCAPICKQAWLADLTFEKLGLEEEDYIRVQGLESSVEFRQKAEQLASMIQQDSMQSGFGGMMPGF